MLYNTMSLMATVDAIVLPGTLLRCIELALMRHDHIRPMTHAVSGRLFLLSVRHPSVPEAPPCFETCSRLVTMRPLVGRAVRCSPSPLCHPMYTRAVFIGVRLKRTTGDENDSSGLCGGSRVFALVVPDSA